MKSSLKGITIQLKMFFFLPLFCVLGKNMFSMYCVFTMLCKFLSAWLIRQHEILLNYKWVFEPCPIIVEISFYLNGSYFNNSLKTALSLLYTLVWPSCWKKIGTALHYTHSEVTNSYISIPLNNSRQESETNKKLQ